MILFLMNYDSYEDLFNYFSSKINSICVSIELFIFIKYILVNF